MTRFCAIVLALLALATPAWGDATEARRHFDAGVKAYDAGNYEDALAEFRAAHAEKPSSGLLRNIALCLAKLGRNAEAIATLERMMAEGGPEVAPIRPATERTLAELRAKCATVHAQVVFNLSPGTAAPSPSVSLDEKVLDNALATVWVDPGTHIIKASAPGFTDGSATIIVKAGERDVAVPISLIAREALTGIVRVKTNMPGSIVKVDGIPIAKGMWAGTLSIGKHRIEAEATGFIGVIQDVDVTEGSDEDVSLELKPEPEKATPPLLLGPHLWYLGASVGFFGGEFPIRDTPKALVSFAFNARFGRRIGHYFAIELSGELVRGSLEYRTPDVISFVYTHAAIGPGIRFLTSEGSPRLTVVGSGGIINQNITQKTSAGDATGGAPSGYLQIEGGGQLDFARSVGMELVVFAGMMGVNDVHLSGDVMSRYGARVSVIFSF